MLPVRNMSPGSVRNAVSASILMIAVNALIQNSTANSETSVSSGRCRGTEGRKKSIRRWGDGEIREKRKKKDERRLTRDEETNAFGITWYGSRDTRCLPLK